MSGTPDVHNVWDCYVVCDSPTTFAMVKMQVSGVKSTKFCSKMKNGYTFLYKKPTLRSPINEGVLISGGAEQFLKME